MYKIERSNYIREEIRNHFTNNNNFIFEHLADGYCRVAINDGVKNAELKFDSNDDLKGIVAKIQKKLEQPYSAVEELFCMINDVSPILKENPHQDLDPKVVLENFKSFNALWTPEEKEESDREIRHTRANRRWLLENKKSFVNTAQTKKFHELANKARDLNQKDYMSILKAYNIAIKE